MTSGSFLRRGPDRAAAPPSDAPRRRRSRGQSLAEFAIIVPVFLLFILAAADFGRVYLGWINLQTMARTAANYAANNASGFQTSNPAVLNRYQELVENDTAKINCTVPGTIPQPVFPSGYDLGDLVEVRIPCQFNLITPILKNFLGSQLTPVASTTMPVKIGAAANVPGGGGGGVIPAPVADFVASPRSGYTPLEVEFTDASLSSPTSWVWAFGDGTTSFSQDPTKTYTTAGIYTVRLTVQNGGGFDGEVKVDHITVVDPPTTGPIPEFSATPRSGTDPLAVSFTDLSTGSPTSWSWDFGDGSAPSTLENPNHTYAATGSYDVTLTVSDGTTSNAQTKVGYINVNTLPCRVPVLIGIRKNSAQGIWSAAGFSTNVQFMAGNGNWVIQEQDLAGGSNPVDGCVAVITVGP
ncbi:MAG TPA: PKD domain-containing protein [Candidatus Limnocylindrales bacterium]|nr:PKD domain-containing protein [Candidatus Limnocylindrales bacterium]